MITPSPHLAHFLAAVLTTAGEKPLEVDYSASERVPLKLAIFAPTKTFATASLSQIIKLANDTLVEKTNLRVEPIETAIPEGRSKFTWLVLQAHPAESVAQARAPFLAVLSVRALEDRDQITAILIDTEEAVRCIEGTHEGAPEGDSGVENCILHYSVRSNPEPAEVGANGVEAYLRKLLLEDFRPALEASGSWEPYGRLLIEGPPPDLEINIDGHLIGRTKPTRSVIGSVAPGAHTVALSPKPGFAAVEGRVTVERAKVATLTLEVPSSLPSKVRAAVIWGGVGLAIAGGAVTAYALEQAATAPNETVCLPSCPSQLLQSGADRSGNPAVGTGNGHGPAIAPIGISLAATGLAWALGTALIGDDDSYPWLQIGGGIAAGIAAVLLTVALNAKSATH